MKKILFTVIALITLGATGAQAQVTIGSTADPQPFSILELDGHGERGLRLPQLNASQKQALTVELTGLTDQVKKDAARGLQIFNTKTRCVETWNGTTWIQKCGEPDPWVEPDVITGCKYGSVDMVIPPVRFAKFNLGADPYYDTPKKQMKYLAETNYPKTDEVTLQLDATVNGGLFQWGRKWDKTSDATSYAVSVENNTYNRYAGSGNHAASISNFSLSINYDDSGQPKTNIGDHLYDGSVPNKNNYDWLVKVTTGLTPPITYNATLGMSPDRWGNGVAVNTKTNPDGVLYNTNYYQSAKWIHSENDPCPPDFRVPTQDEWERLGAYDCRPDQAGGNFDTSITGTTFNVYGNPVKGTGKGLTWIPVVCNTDDYPGRCVPSSGWLSGTTSSGYAIYETDEWEAAINTGVYKDWQRTTEDFNIKNADNTTYKYPSLHEEATAPDPILFLPAAGYRYNVTGNVNNIGNYGRYWSSTVVGTNAHNLDLSSDAVRPNNEANRGYGFSVRCVAE